MINPSSTMVSYKPLRKLIIDKELQKQNLRKTTSSPGTTIVKLGRDGNVMTTVLVKICEVLNRDIADICEVVPTDLKKGTK